MSRPFLDQKKTPAKLAKMPSGDISEIENYVNKPLHMVIQH